VWKEDGLINALCNLPNTTTRLLFLSRDEPRIRSHLSTWPQLEIGRDSTTQDDLQLFVSERFTELQEHVPHLQGRDDIETHLFNVASGMFLYVRLLVDTIISSKDLAPSDVDDMLTHSPDGLGQMYQKYLVELMKNNNDTQNRIAVRALQWILYSEQPMRLTVLNDLLAMDVRLGDFNTNKRHANIEAVLRHVLGILLYFQHDEDGVVHVTLVHQSFKDFLIRMHPSEGYPELKNLYTSTRPETAHSRLFMTCCAILTLPFVTSQIQRCYDASDMLLPGQQQEKGVLKLPELSVLRALLDLLDLRDLQELVERKELAWEVAAELARDLVRELAGELRELAEELARERLKKLLELLGLQVLRPLPTPRELHDLRALLLWTSVDMAKYSLQEFPSHLAGAAMDSLSTPSLLTVIFVLLEQCSCSATAVASATSRMIAKGLPPSCNLSTCNDLAFGLQLLARTTSDVLDYLGPVEHLTYAHYYGTFSPYVPSTIRSLVRNVLARFSPWPHAGPNDDNIDTLLSISSYDRKALRFVMAAQTALQTVEHVLYHSDAKLPVVLGMSNLIYTIRCTEQNLSRWLLLHLPPPLHTPSLVQTLADGTSLCFINYNPAGPHIRGLLLFDKDLWNYHPHLLSFAYLACLLVGIIFSVPIWVTISLTLVFSETHRFDFETRDPSLTRRTTRSILSFCIFGQLLSMCCHFTSICVLSTMGSVYLVLYVRRLLRFRLYFSGGDVRLVADLINERLQTSAILFLTNINQASICAVWDLLSSAIFTYISFNAALNLVAMHFIFHQVLIASADPRGLQQTSVVLEDIPAIFDELWPRISDAQREQRQYLAEKF
jgi:hypothetical protein